MFRKKSHLNTSSSKYNNAISIAKKYFAISIAAAKKNKLSPIHVHMIHVKWNHDCGCQAKGYLVTGFLATTLSVAMATCPYLTTVSEQDLTFFDLLCWKSFFKVQYKEQLDSVTPICSWNIRFVCYFSFLPSPEHQYLYPFPQKRVFKCCYGNRQRWLDVIKC